MWRIYLDTCCLNRPFNDRSQERIRREAEVILAVLERCTRGEWRWISSDAIADEVAQIRDGSHRLRVTLLAEGAHEQIALENVHVERARVLQSVGFGSMDALHLACAEAASADVLLTTDDRFVRVARRVADQLRTRVLNPVAWLEEVVTE